MLSAAARKIRRRTLDSSSAASAGKSAYLKSPHPPPALPIDTAEWEEEVQLPGQTVDVQADWQELLSPLQLERQRTVQELITSERSFVQDIRSFLLSHRPLMLNSPRLRSQDRLKLETCLEPLWDVLASNERLLAVLDTLPRDVETGCVLGVAVHVFAAVDLFEGPYSRFAATCEEVQAFLVHLQSIYSADDCPELFVIDGGSSESGGGGSGGTVVELMAKPMQRLMRYRLLFERLAETTGECDDDFMSAGVLLERVKTILDTISSLKDRLDRIRELKRYEREMSFRHAVSLDGKKKRAPKFSFQVYRDDGSRYVELQDTFCMVSPSKSSSHHLLGGGGDKLPFSVKQFVVMFITNDLLFIGAEMSSAERKKEPGKRWRMFHEPIPVSQAHMELLPSVTVKGKYFHWFRLALEPGEVYFLSAPLKQIEQWTRLINVVPGDLQDSMNAGAGDQSQRSLSRRGSIIKSVIQSLISSRASTRSSTPGFESVPAVHNNSLAREESLPTAVSSSLESRYSSICGLLPNDDDCIYKCTGKGYYWSGSVESPGWTSLDVCRLMLRHDSSSIQGADADSVVLSLFSEQGKLLFESNVGASDLCMDLKIENAIRKSRKRSSAGSKSEFGADELRENSQLSMKLLPTSAINMEHLNHSYSVLIRIKSHDRAKEMVSCVEKAQRAQFTLDLERRLLENAKRQQEAEEVLEAQKAKEEQLVTERISSVVYELIDSAVVEFSNLQKSGEDEPVNVFMSDENEEISSFVAGSIMLDDDQSEMQEDGYQLMLDDDSHSHPKVHSRCSSMKHLLADVVKCDPATELAVETHMNSAVAEVESQLQKLDAFDAKVVKELPPNASRLKHLLSNWHMRLTDAAMQNDLKFDVEMLKTEYEMALVWLYELVDAELI